MGFKASIEVHFVSAPRPPTHLGAQLGDGPHSPVGWRADRSTAGLYGSQDAKSSRTKPPGTGPRGRQPPRHPPPKGPLTQRARNTGRRTSPRCGRAGARPAATGPPPPATDQQLTTVNRRYAADDDGTTAAKREPPRTQTAPAPGGNPPHTRRQAPLTPVSQCRTRRRLTSRFPACEADTGHPAEPQIGAKDVFWRAAKTDPARQPPQRPDIRSPVFGPKARLDQ